MLASFASKAIYRRTGCRALSSVAAVGAHGRDLANRLMSGDRLALSKAITLVESTRRNHQLEAEAMLMYCLEKQKQQEEQGQLRQNPARGVHVGQTSLVRPRSIKSFRLGISGPPGAGKSTFIEAFGMALAKAGHRVAVLAVDPSSQITGGSLLGDKARMNELALLDSAYVRASPSRGSLGGVAHNTMEAIALCEAAGYDRILVETVGVGQSEIAVAHITDMLALLVPPAGGDELQGMKKGIVEMADLVIVNKADGSLKTLANHAKVEYMHALQLLRHKSHNWTPMVQTCSSIEKDGSLDVIMSAINQYKDTMVVSGELFEQRKTQRRKWMWDQLHEELIDVLRQEPSVEELISAVERKVDANLTTPKLGARDILTSFLTSNSFARGTASQPL